MKERLKRALVLDGWEWDDINIKFHRRPRKGPLFQRVHYNRLTYGDRVGTGRYEECQHWQINLLIANINIHLSREER